MSVFYVGEKEVLELFDKQREMRPVAFEEVGTFCRGGYTFTKRGDKFFKGDEETTLASIVEFWNDHVAWLSGTRRRGPEIITDTQEGLRHPLTGKVVDSKSKFRQMTKDHGGVEVGNEDLGKIAEKNAERVDRDRKRSLRETIHKNYQIHRGV
jgi:hypothetical protein